MPGFDIGKLDPAFLSVKSLSIPNGSKQRPIFSTLKVFGNVGATFPEGGNIPCILNSTFLTPEASHSPYLAPSAPFFQWRFAYSCT